MAIENPDFPNQNSKPESEGAPVVIRSIAAPGAASPTRVMPVLLLAWIVSGIVHAVLLFLFLFVTVNTTSANLTTETKVIDTQIDDEKPKDANLTNDDLGLDPDQALNFNNVRIEPISVPGPVKMDEKVGNSDIAESAPVNVPPPPGLFGNNENLGGGIKSPNIGLMNPNMFGGGMKGIYSAGGIGGRSGATREQLMREGGGNT